MAEDALFQRFGKEFRRGDVLFREGEPGKEMYVIQAGKVNITKTVRETEKILATLGAGEFFGEMSILNHKPRSAGAVVPEGVLVPDTGKMKKYLEFLEMKERFGD